ncbi:MAG: hypothetical protein SXA11_04010 [Cyanobacteriota bacterium]|nr:hypothetical protein [Cyanobacteriota bacterium]
MKSHCYDIEKYKNPITLEQFRDRIDQQKVIDAEKSKLNLEKQIPRLGVFVFGNSPSKTLHSIKHQKGDRCDKVDDAADLSIALF